MSSYCLWEFLILVIGGVVQNHNLKRAKRERDGERRRMEEIYLVGGSRFLVVNIYNKIVSDKRMSDQDI